MTLVETRLAWDDVVSSDPLLSSLRTSFRLLGKEFSGVEAAAAEMFSKLSNLDLLNLSMVVTGLLAAGVFLLFSRVLEVEATLVLSGLGLSSVLEVELVIIRLCRILVDREAGAACLGLKSARPPGIRILAKCKFKSSIKLTRHLAAQGAFLVPSDAGEASLMAARVHQAPLVASEK